MALKRTFVGLIPRQVLLSSERLGKSHSPIDVANLMEKCIRINYLCVTDSDFTMHSHGLARHLFLDIAPISIHRINVLYSILYSWVFKNQPILRADQLKTFNQEQSQ
jgi:hypothetical protein